MNKKLEKKITKELVGDIVAFLIREEHYEELRNEQGYTLEQNSKGDYEVCFGTGENKKVFKCREDRYRAFYNICIPNEVSQEAVEDELYYVLSIDSQISQQAMLLDINNCVKYLGSFHGRGGIKIGDLKIILNWCDLYDIYWNDKQVATDIYFDTLADEITEYIIQGA